jgi:lysozyme
MKNFHKIGAGSSAGVFAVAMVFTPMWEGLDLVAKRDMVGTGHPLTYCNGLTSTDGKVRAGQRFTPAQCKVLLAEAFPKYWSKIEPCIHVPLPDKTAASLLDAGFNAGPTAVCRSPMLAKMNAGDLRGGCDAFEGWYITTKNNGQRRRIKGLVARRSGVKGDFRKTEKLLCHEGINEATVRKSLWQKVTGK